MQITLLKQYIKIKRWFQKISKKTVVIRPEHQKTIDIILRLAHNKESILLMCPKSGKRYIEAHKEVDGDAPYGEIFIVIDQTDISIMNGVYYYDVTLSTEAALDMIDEFDKEIYRRRRLLELIKRQNINKRLNELMSKIK